MEKAELEDLFERYLAGRATPEEVKHLLNYFKLDAESKMLTEMVVAEMSKPANTDEITLASRQPIYSRVYQDLQARIDTEQRSIVPLWNKPLFHIAAAVIIIFFGGMATVYFKSAQPELITVYAPMGKVKQVTLPDNSKIWLNAGSQLQYAKDFISAKTRTVYLTGQGFFDVVHQTQHPFIVHTKSVAITVLGTSFEVKAFATEKETKVTVSTGKVGITFSGTREPALFLLPGQQIVVSSTSRRTIKKNEALNDIAAWRENKLVFDNEPLDNVFHALERKYNVHIEVLTPALLNEVTSMKLDNQPLSDVMTTLSFSKHFHYELANDSTVVIK